MCENIRVISSENFVSFLVIEDEDRFCCSLTRKDTKRFVENAKKIFEDNNVINEISFEIGDMHITIVLMDFSIVLSFKNMKTSKEFDIAFQTNFFNWILDSMSSVSQSIHSIYGDSETENQWNIVDEIPCSIF